MYSSTFGYTLHQDELAQPLPAVFPLNMVRYVSLFGWCSFPSTTSGIRSYPNFLLYDTYLTPSLAALERKLTIGLEYPSKGQWRIAGQ